MTIPECFKILGIDVCYDEKAIKSAFRKRANELHPDKNPNPAAHECFLMVKEAYDTLVLYLELRDKYGDLIGGMIADEEEHREQEIRDRVREARRKQEQKLAREQALIRSIYSRYTRSWRIYAVALLAVLSLPVAYMLAYDFIASGQVETSVVSHMRTSAPGGTPEQMVYADYYITVKGREIAVLPDFYLVCKEGQPVKVVVGHFFGGIKHMETTFLGHICEQQPLGFFNDAWIVLVILLLVPTLSFAFMKANFIFVFFFIHFNLYVSPLVLTYVLLGDARVFHLWANLIPTCSTSISSCI